MPRHKIPDFFDPKSRRLTEDILSGKTPLVDVNRPGVSPNVLSFFQDPKNQARIAKPLAGGLDRVANQAAVDARVPAAKRAIFAKRGVPQRIGDETQEEMVKRLRRGGRNRESAALDASERFRLNDQLKQRRAERDQRRIDLDERRRAAGRPTSEDREAQRQEAFKRIRERKGIFREDVNRRRKAAGLKPFGPVVRDEPILIQSPDDVDPKVHGSGQDFDTPDGDTFRLVINPSGDQTLVPTRIDPRTGQRVIDSREIDSNEFQESLTDTERQVRRGLIFGSGTLFARDLRAIHNNIAAIEKAKSNGTIDPQTAEEQTEKLMNDEAELMFRFDKIDGFSTAFEAESEADIAEQEAQQQAQIDRAKERRVLVSKLVTDVTKELKEAAKAVADRTKGGVPRQITSDEIREEVQRRLEIINSLTGQVDVAQPSQENEQQVESPTSSPVPSPAGSASDIIAASQAQLRAVRDRTGEPAIYIDGSPESFNRLVPGTAFIGPDGIKRRKQ